MLDWWFYKIWIKLSNPLHKMIFSGGVRGSKRLIPYNPLLKIVSKKYGPMLRTVENMIENIILSHFVGKKLEATRSLHRKWRTYFSSWFCLQWHISSILSNVKQVRSHTYNYICGEFKFWLRILVFNLKL